MNSMISKRGACVLTNKDKCAAARKGGKGGLSEKERPATHNTRQAQRVGSGLTGSELRNHSRHSCYPSR